MLYEAENRKPGDYSPDRSRPAAALAQNALDIDSPTAGASPGSVQARAPAERGPVDFRSTPENQPRQRGDGEPRRRLPLRRTLLLAIALPLLTALTAVGYLYWNYTGHFETTDDAFIAARTFPIAPKVSGYITAVPVTDNQHVAAGNVIARIDDRDYRVALDQANAQVSNATANIQNMDAEIAVQEAQINANQAQVDQTQATLVFAQQQAARYQQLAQNGAGSVQNAQQYTSQLHEQQAAFASAQANLKLAQRRIDALKAQRASAAANLAQAEAQRDQAQLNLSYTQVRAAQAGRIVNLTAAAGQFAQAGTNLTMFVPDEIWVTANFKETQLDAMRPEQPVTLHIDAYPERTIRGHVASIQPGSGPAFSLLPPENATGNYVKIVQRVPVKIIIDDPPTDLALGPGMSVEPSVRVNPNPSLYERLRARL